MASTSRFHVSPASIGLFVYTFAVQFIDLIYVTYEMALPPVFEFLSPFAFLGFICWWFKADSERHRIRWPMDMGMFLHSAWFLLVPYHLFRTRGLRAFISISSFVGVMAAAWLAVFLTVTIFESLDS
jgi:hypothetical protein